jgi:hypothetical protein
MNKIFSSSVVLGLFLLISYCVAADCPDCQTPNDDTKKCYSPTDAAFCGGWNEADCGNKKVYSINDFPDGVECTDEGVTKESLIPCWRYKQCYWDRNVSPPACATATSWSPYNYANKTVVDPNKTCPQTGS